MPFHLAWAGNAQILVRHDAGQVVLQNRSDCGNRHGLFRTCERRHKIILEGYAELRLTGCYHCFCTVIRRLYDFYINTGLIEVSKFIGNIDSCVIGVRGPVQYKRNGCILSGFLFRSAAVAAGCQSEDHHQRCEHQCCQTYKCDYFFHDCLSIVILPRTGYRRTSGTAIRICR